MPLTVAGPPPDADPSQLLVDTAITGLAQQRSQTPGLRTDYQQGVDATSVLSALASSQTSLGWLSAGDATANAATVAPLAVDGGDGCVNPDQDKIFSGVYPLSRTLYLYVNLGTAYSNPAVAAFVDSALGDDTLSTALSSLPLVPLPSDVLQETRFAWEGR